MFKPAFHRTTVLGSLSLLFIALATSWPLFWVHSAADGEDVQIVNSPGVVSSVRVVTLTANDIVYNSADDKLYVSRASSAGADGNSIVRIDPRTSTVGPAVFVGSEPNKLAI